MNEVERHWTELMEENLVDATLAFIFLLPFVLIGVVSIYFIETLIIKDIVLGLSCLAGVFTLYRKVVGEN